MEQCQGHVEVYLFAICYSVTCDLWKTEEDSIHRPWAVNMSVYCAMKSHAIQKKAHALKKDSKSAFRLMQQTCFKRRPTLNRCIFHPTCQPFEICNNYLDKVN